MLIHEELIPTRISRREFLRLASIGLIGSASGLHPTDDFEKPIFYGRALFVYVTVYSRPSVFGRTVRLINYQAIVPIYAKTQSHETGTQNPTWYQTSDGYIHSSNVQPVQDQPNRPIDVSAPHPGQVTIPFVDAYTQPQLSSHVLYRLYYSSIHWIQRLVRDSSGQAWYELWDDRINSSYYAPTRALRIIPASEFAPIAPDIADKRIEIDTTAEALTALENGQPVYRARISSGGKFSGPGGTVKDFRTPLGNHVIDRKRPSRHMAAGDGAADDAYDLPGVPWVCYFNGGMAIHGTYWHNDYGRPWSHGCINAAPLDARWLYRWTLPTASVDQPLATGPGTPVVVV